MSGTFVDTNVLLRHLTGEPPDQARRATRLLADAAPGSLRLPDLIVAEMVYVLESHYRVERTALAGILRAVLGSPALAVADRPLLIRALEHYELDRLGFPDAYLVACAEGERDGTVVTFDRGIHRVAAGLSREPA